MADSNGLGALDKLLGDIKNILGSLSILDKATENKDQVSQATALDAINFRVREISNAFVTSSLKISPTNLKTSKTSTVFSIENILLELGKTDPDAKVLHSLLDDQLETLRKMALSEVLTLSIE